MNDQQLYLNGVNGASGDFLFPAMTPEQLADLLGKQRDLIDPKLLEELRLFLERFEREFVVIPGVDTNDLAQAGWGVIFARGADPALKEALKELLDHRRQQAGELYREFSDFPDRPANFDTPYAPPERKYKFLERHRVGFSVVDPKKMPYYLLIVGDPREVPFSFQQEMDVQHAVGRVWFETEDGRPDLDAFARYARSVVQAEKKVPNLAPRGVFFGVRNKGDMATSLSTEHLVQPLAKYVQEEFPDWQFETVLAGDATRTRLGDLLGGDETPALLFTASHGMGFPSGDPRQLPHQGALLCQDWPGALAWGRKPIPPEHYFAADDVANGASLQGLIAFFFACYGGGTPQHDEFAHRALGHPIEIAPRAFVARLPQKLLGHEQGGALAVIAHVERAWGFSFWWGAAGAQRTTFEAALTLLLHGCPVGSAVEPFNQYYADLATSLSRIFEEMHLGREPDKRELSSMWTANNDARNYVIFGDPAVRLRVKPS